MNGTINLDNIDEVIDLHRYGYFEFDPATKAKYGVASQGRPILYNENQLKSLITAFDSTHPLHERFTSDITSHINKYLREKTGSRHMTIQKFINLPHASSEDIALSNALAEVFETDMSEYTGIWSVPAFLMPNTLREIAYLQRLPADLRSEEGMLWNLGKNIVFDAIQLYLFAGGSVTTLKSLLGAGF